MQPPEFSILHLQIGIVAFKIFLWPFKMTFWPWRRQDLAYDMHLDEFSPNTRFSPIHHFLPFWPLAAFNGLEGQIWPEPKLLMWPWSTWFFISLFLVWEGYNFGPRRATEMVLPPLDRKTPQDFVRLLIRIWFSSIILLFIKKIFSKNSKTAHFSFVFQTLQTRIGQFPL